jgi:glucokinase
VIPVLEIGGSHVTAALVDGDRIHSRASTGIAGTATAGEILDAVAACATRLGAPAGATWGVAVPGPFDYATGVARYRGVGKFDALDGVDVGSALRHRIEPRPARLRFLNDAIAFGLGEWAFGAASGHDRAVAITLGTGVGSAFLSYGVAVTTGPEVPPEGRADLLSIDGHPLEQTVSTRGIVAAYGNLEIDVAQVAARAVTGDVRARLVLESAFRKLGGALAPWLHRFGATVLVVGGGITGAWDVIGGPLRDGLLLADGLLPADGLTLAVSADSQTSALLGASRPEIVGRPR